MLTFINTLPMKRQKYWRRRMFSGEINDRKERKKVKSFQNKFVSSQNGRSKKRRGRHCSGVSPTFSHSAKQCGQFRLSFAGRTGSVLPWKPSNLQRESPINYHKCPTFDTKRETPAIFRHLIGPPKQIQIQRCRMSLRKQTKNIM